MPSSFSDRLVSHRLRGFSDHENSLSALERGLAAGVRYIEIDTRVTRDGQVLVFHDARFDPLTDRTGHVSDFRLGADRRPRFRGSSTETIATLEEFLGRFAEIPSTAELLIDVKDPGAEQRHCEIIDASGLADRIRILSWWPEVLLTMHTIDPGLRLVLGFVPLDRGPWWLQSVRWFGSGSLVRRLGRLGGRSRLAHYMRDTLFRREPFDSLDSWALRSVGRYPVCFTEGLPGPELTDALATSGGGIATWPRVIDHALVEQARSRGLQTLSFSLNDAPSVEAMLNGPGPELVFTNNVELFD